jgi:hypothetical protein
MILKNNMQKIIISFIVIMISLLVYINFIYEDPRIKMVNDTVKMIENYKIVNKKLPKSFSDLYLDYGDLGPIYYSILSDEKGEYYLVTYSNGFDENPGFNSRTNSWEEY